jgi:hypothetical protein
VLYWNSTNGIWSVKASAASTPAKLPEISKIAAYRATEAMLVVKMLYR